MSLVIKIITTLQSICPYSKAISDIFFKVNYHIYFVDSTTSAYIQII